MRWWKTMVNGLACAGLMAACVPAQALAGENATAVELARYDETIQGTIDALDSLEAGQDYVEGELLVTYSGSLPNVFSGAVFRLRGAVGWVRPASNRQRRAPCTSRHAT